MTHKVAVVTGAAGDIGRAIAKRLAEVGPTWLEEPIAHDDLPGYRRLSARSPIPLAGGEAEFVAAAEGLERDFRAWLPDAQRFVADWLNAFDSLMEAA